LTAITAATRLGPNRVVIPTRRKRIAVGVEQFRRFAAARDVLVQRRVAERFVAAAKAAVPLEPAGCRT
jgi:hypothetical protein